MLSHQSREYFPRSLGHHQVFWQMWIFVFFLVISGFLLGTLQRVPFLPSLCYCWIMNTDHNWRNVWPFSSLDVILSSFVTSWMNCRCPLGVILVAWPLRRRFTMVPLFLHLWKIALTMQSQCLRNGSFQPVTLTDSKQVLHFYRWWHDLGLFEVYKPISLGHTDSVSISSWFNRSGSSQDWL